MVGPQPRGATPTVLIIPALPVPPGLAAFRERYIHHPGAVVPFHTTMVSPFLDLEALDADVHARLRRVAAGLSPFDYAAGSICVFPTSAALWLAPNPVAPFEACAEAVYEAFPTVRPVDGYPTFHLTVGLGRTADDLPDMVRAFRDAFGARLPLRCRARHLELYAEVEGRYERLARFALGGGASSVRTVASAV
jgi:hypothetical protein